MITFEQKGNFDKTRQFLSTASKGLHLNDLSRFGEEGVKALRDSTPKDSGETASCWSYKIIKGKGTTTISWFNSNKVDGVPIAVILQYGHATKNGGWVTGRDYINPVMQPIFDKIASNAWKEVSKI